MSCTVSVTRKLKITLNLKKINPFSIDDFIEHKEFSILQQQFYSCYINGESIRIVDHSQFPRVYKGKNMGYVF